MKAEQKLVDFVLHTTFSDLTEDVLKMVKNQVFAVLGTTIAGAWAEGCETLIALSRDLGGKEEASVLIHGGKIPAHQAAFINGIMARALDFCDALAPGAHIGSAVIPASLAAAELAEGCSGADFLAAVAVGTETAIRLNFGENEYDGFDPTGVCVVFAATAAAARILRLSETQTWNALALAFNKCGGSFQSNVDGALAVRVIEGWVAETGVTCARFAERGITGPANFLEGLYGYFHLFGRDRVIAEDAFSGLGKVFRIDRLVFKKYPSCGLTQGSTDLILKMVEDKDFNADDVEHVNVTVPPYTYKLVGHPFKVGNNPKVNAQFSIRYCVANALIRKGAKLAHFEESAIKDPEVLKLAEKIEVVSDSTIAERGHTPLDMQVVTKDGKQYTGKMDIAPGFPGNPLTEEEHRQRFLDCIGFSTKQFPDEKVKSIMNATYHMETMRDIRDFIPLLLLKS